MGLKIHSFKQSKLAKLINIVDEIYTNVYVYLRGVKKNTTSTRDKIFNNIEDIDDYIYGTFYFSTENSAAFFSINIEIPVVNVDAEIHLYEEFKKKLDNVGIVYENIFDNITQTQQPTLSDQVLILTQENISLNNEVNILKSALNELLTVAGKNTI